MATFNGSAGDDFIHVAGDGHSPPDGSTEFDEASAGFDDITPGAGFDTVYAGDGVDRVHFSGSKDSAPQKPAQTFEEISEDDGDLPF